MGQDQSIPPKDLITTADNSQLPEAILQAMTTQKLGYVYLGAGRWSQHRMGQWMPSVREWKLRKGLVLDSNYEPTILRQLAGVRFEFLLQLSLRQNNIESIEVFAEFYMPNLQKIFFCQNNICSLKPLRKFSIPNIIYMSFSANETLEMEYFNYLESESLEEFILDTNKPGRRARNNVVSINSLAKLKSKLMIKAWFGTDNHGLQEKVLTALRRRSPQFMKLEKMGDINQECSKIHA